MRIVTIRLSVLGLLYHLFLGVTKTLYTYLFDWETQVKTKVSKLRLEAENESRLEIDLREIKAFNSVGPIDDGKFSRCQGFGYVSDTGIMAKLPYPCNIGKHYSNIGILF